MQIRLQKIADEPLRWEESPSIPLATLDRPELVGLSDLSWSGQVSRELAGYRFEARLTYRQQLCCTRCLTTVELPVDERLELMVLVGAAQPLLGEHELTAAELTTLYLDDDLLDTTPILLEQLQLNVPMKPLCREECAGLCPACGVDRNRERCGCAPTAVDPRWSALEGWRDS